MIKRKHRYLYLQLYCTYYHRIPDQSANFKFVSTFNAVRACHPIYRQQHLGTLANKLHIELNIQLSLTSLFRPFALLIQRNHGPSTRLSVPSRPAHLDAHYRSQLDWSTGLCNLSHIRTGAGTKTRLPTCNLYATGHLLPAY